MASEGRDVGDVQAVDDEEGRGRDPLRRIVHVTLAFYLLPVLAIVLVLGCVLVVLNGLANSLSGLVSMRRHPIALASRRTIKAPMTDRYGRIRRVAPRHGGADETANDPLG